MLLNMRLTYAARNGAVSLQPNSSLRKLVPFTGACLCVRMSAMQDLDKEARQSVGISKDWPSLILRQGTKTGKSCGGT